VRILLHSNRLGLKLFWLFLLYVQWPWNESLIVDIIYLYLILVFL
jgi:hypothetical protein